jgi:hypothetical protein
MAAPCSNSSRSTRLNHHADAQNGVALRRNRRARECRAIGGNASASEGGHLLPRRLDPRVEIFRQVQEVDTLCAFLTGFHPNKRDRYFVRADFLHKLCRI